MAETTTSGYAALIDDLRARRAEAAAGGPEASRRRHLERGKMLARDRVDALLDRGSPFLEIAPLAACDLEDAWPAAGQDFFHGSMLHPRR